jgi:hypothetical protein
MLMRRTNPNNSVTNPAIITIAHYGLSVFDFAARPRPSRPMMRSIMNTVHAISLRSSRIDCRERSILNDLA